MRRWLAVAGVLGSTARAAPCPRWGEGQEIGLLDPAFLPEASGLAASRRFGGRLYHINDSGDGGFLYVTDAQGGATRRVAIEGFSPRDAEDLALGPCGGGRTCLFAADIGDNNRERADLTVVLVEELDPLPDVIAPYRTLTLRYPDGPRDAEALVVHPGGDLLVITKERGPAGLKALPARVYRLPRAAVEGGEPKRTLEPWGSIDVPALVPGDNLFAQIVTAADVSPDGSRLLLTTYKVAIEVDFDLASGPVPPDVTATSAPLLDLPQIEAVAYLPDGAGFLYDTEHHEKLGRRPPLVRVRCREP